MKKIMLLALSSLALLLLGCSAAQVQYHPEAITNKDSAIKIIEQVIMEQPLKYRPEGIIITDDYLLLGNGISGKSHGSTYGSTYGSTLNNTSSTSTLALTSTSSSRSKFNVKNITDRFYFNSLAKPELFKKRDWYIIELKSDENRILKRFYTHNLKKAEAFIDSINFFSAKAVAFYQK